MKKQDDDDEDAEEACRNLRFDDSMIASVVRSTNYPITGLRPKLSLN